jgi:hypothetical protein
VSCPRRRVVGQQEPGVIERIAEGVAKVTQALAVRTVQASQLMAVIRDERGEQRCISQVPLGIP